jgi:hypothetical protein
LTAGLIALAWASVLAAQSGASVAGQVVDGRTGLGLSDVRVQLQGNPGTVLTDRDGRFVLTGVP